MLVLRFIFGHQWQQSHRRNDWMEVVRRNNTFYLPPEIAPTSSTDNHVNAPVEASHPDADKAEMEALRDAVVAMTPNAMNRTTCVPSLSDSAPVAIYKHRTTTTLTEFWLQDDVRCLTGRRLLCK